MSAELEGERLDRALATLVPGLSRGLARKIVGMGGAYLGRERCRVAGRKVRPGDLLTVTWHPDVTEAKRFPLSVIYEDADLVVVDKPSGQIVQGTELGDTGTLERELQRAFGAATRLMHRLDGPASGLLVAARSSKAAAPLSAQFRAHDLGRGYVLAAAGVPATGECHVPLLKAGRRMRPATAGEDGALPAHTDVGVLRVAPDRSAALATAMLHTGRTHQIRVHLATLGAPLVGDRLYGGPPAPRLALHAAWLRFRHPGGRMLSFARPPGDDFWVAAGPGLRYTPAP